MKIVVASGIGIQNDINSQIINYSGVPDNYNLSGLIDVTSFSTLSLFYQIHRMNYTGYRDSVGRYWRNAYTGNWDATETANKKILAQLFLVDSGNRGEMLNSLEISDWATKFVCENVQGAQCSKAEVIKYNSVARLDRDIVSGNADVFDKYDKTGGVISGNVTISGNLIVSGSSSFQALQRTLGSLYISGNVTATTFSAMGEFRLCSGTMLSGLINSNFELSNNQLKYIGISEFTGVCNAVGSHGTDLVGMTYTASIFKNGTVHNNSTTNGVVTTRPGNFSLIKPITLSSGDVVGVGIKNNSSSSSITVTDLDLIVY